MLCETRIAILFTHDERDATTVQYERWQRTATNRVYYNNRIIREIEKWSAAAGRWMDDVTEKNDAR